MFERLENKFIDTLAPSDRQALIDLMRGYTEPIQEFGMDCMDLAYNTACILSEIGMERSSIVLALVEPFVHWGMLSMADAERLFGEDVARLLSLVARLKNKTITLENMSDAQFSDFVISFVEDIRVVIYLTVNRREVMLALDAVEDDGEHETLNEERTRQAALSRLFYAPIAHRLGFYGIKRDLEDLSVKFEHPEEYYKIVGELKQTREERDQYLQDFIAPLREKIEELQIPYEIKWRTKSINSIYTKMQSKEVGIDGIYDLFALRVILDVPEKLEKAVCWAIFGVASSLYVPNMLRTKDWVGKPKSSGYESLHTTMLGPDNHWVEIQIRSKRMDKVAEHGLAAHWIYKGVKGSDDAVNEALLAIRTAIENHTGVDTLIKSFSDELFKGEMFVFDNSDELHKIPSGSRIVDYIIHVAPEPDWVELFCGANVNGEFKPLDHTLKNGDRVELVIRM
ncbi:MAG: bifunctional (p)ppGpp synthetase/guanosine-3',5'-bis(diphosphate) 3'-pyrophosphohydrolase [Bacteroidaceae bacterium]|nr:bifunctional (p)ppGpp synthetase/guanosine-3',5'-bis(diphosphate) 3'-pyrophosphohydrolase [Bacteroidaceae bacterium]